MLEREVAAAAAGDREAFGQLVLRHRRLVSSIALAHLRDEAASEDVAQEVFIEAWKGLRQLRNASSFLPWLRQLSRNIALHHVRSRTRAVAQAPLDDALLDRVADPRAHDGEALVRTEEQRALEQALDALPDEAREWVLLYYREGQSTSQVAALFGLSEEAVRQRLSRARKRIREDVFARLSEPQRSDDDFVRGVLLALPGAAPAAGAVASAKALLAKGGASALGAGVAGATVGAALGISGGWRGLRPYLKAAATDEERRTLRRMGGVMTAGVLVFTVAMPGLMALTRRIWPGFAAFLLFLALLGYLYLWRLPQVSALARDGRMTRRRWAGMLAGAAMGSAPFVYFWLSAGRWR